MGTKVTLRKWGNSLGVVFPKAFIDQQHLNVNDEVYVEIVKKANLKPLFGSLKSKRRLSGQQFKNMVRKGWD